MSPRHAAEARGAVGHPGIVVALSLLAVAMVAGVVHIASLLLLPRVAPDDAFARLAAVTPANAIAVLPRGGTAAAAVPDRDPAAAAAVCRYDLDRGPLWVRAAPSDEAFLALTLHARSGVAFYGLNDRAGNDGRLEVVVMTREQLEAARSRDVPGTPVRDVRVSAPEPQGFVLFDVLPRVGGYAEARRALSSMGCGVQHPP